MLIQESRNRGFQWGLGISSGWRGEATSRKVCCQKKEIMPGQPIGGSTLNLRHSCLSQSPSAHHSKVVHASPVRLRVLLRPARVQRHGLLFLMRQCNENRGVGLPWRQNYQPYDVALWKLTSRMRLMAIADAAANINIQPGVQVIMIRLGHVGRRPGQLQAAAVAPEEPHLEAGGSMPGRP